MPDSSLRAEALGAHLPPLVVQAERVAATVMQGVHGRRRAGTGDSFWQFRPYLAGDAATRVDWRQSARADRLFVRETEWEAAQTVVLWRDGGGRMEWRSHLADTTKRERASLLLLALAALLLRGGERVRLLPGPPRSFHGRGALPALAAALATQSGDPGDAGSLPRHARLVLFSDFLAPGVASGQPLPYRLVRFDPEQRRLSSLKWTAGIEAPNQFADGFPLLVTSAASLDGLNRRLQAQGQDPVTMERFRPNIVLSGIEERDETGQGLRAVDGSVAVVRSGHWSPPSGDAGTSPRSRA